MAVPNINDVKNLVNNYKIRLYESINKLIKFKRLNLDKLTTSYVLNNPSLMYQNKEQQLMLMVDKVNDLIKQNIKEKGIFLNHIIEKLELINPLGVLKRGYTLTYMDDKIINSTKSIKKDDTLKIRFSDGIVNTKVIDKE